MTDAELDGLLLLAFHPKKREKLNLTDKELFLHIIVDQIKASCLESEFGENIIHFVTIKPTPTDPKEVKAPRTDLGYIAFLIFTIDMKLVKMSALKTFDEYKESLK